MLFHSFVRPLLHSLPDPRTGSPFPSYSRGPRRLLGQLSAVARLPGVVSEKQLVAFRKRA
jgi:hypothetical protein